MIRTSVAHSAAFSGEKPVATRRTTGSGNSIADQRDQPEVDRQRRHHAVRERERRRARLAAAASRRRSARTPSTARPRRTDRAAGSGCGTPPGTRRCTRPRPASPRRPARARGPSRRDSIVSALTRRAPLASRAPPSSWPPARRLRRRLRRHHGFPDGGRTPSSTARSRSGDGGRRCSSSSSARSCGVPAAARQSSISTASSGGVVGAAAIVARRRDRLRAAAARSCRSCPVRASIRHAAAVAAALTPRSASAIASRSNASRSPPAAATIIAARRSAGVPSRASGARSAPLPQLGAAAATASSAASRVGQRRVRSPGERPQRRARARDHVGRHLPLLERASAPRRRAARPAPSRPPPRAASPTRRSDRWPRRSAARRRARAAAPPAPPRRRPARRLAIASPSRTRPIRSAARASAARSPRLCAFTSSANAGASRPVRGFGRRDARAGLLSPAPAGLPPAPRRAIRRRRMTARTRARTTSGLSPLWHRRLLFLLSWSRPSRSPSSGAASTADLVAAAATRTPSPSVTTKSSRRSSFAPRSTGTSNTCTSRGARRIGHVGRPQHQRCASRAGRSRNASTWTRQNPAV